MALCVCSEMEERPKPVDQLITFANNGAVVLGIYDTLDCAWWLSVFIKQCGARARGHVIGIVLVGGINWL